MNRARPRCGCAHSLYRSGLAHRVRARLGRVRVIELGVVNRRIMSGDSSEYGRPTPAVPFVGGGGEASVAQQPLGDARVDGAEARDRVLTIPNLISFARLLG